MLCIHSSAPNRGGAATAGPKPCKGSRRRFPGRGSRGQSRKEVIMLYTIVVVLLILWLLGLVTSYTMGGFIHILLVVAIVVVLYRVISGRSVV